MLSASVLLPFIESFQSKTSRVAKCLERYKTWILIAPQQNQCEGEEREGPLIWQLHQSNTIHTSYIPGQSSRGICHKLQGVGVPQHGCSQMPGAALRCNLYNLAIIQKTESQSSEPSESQVFMVFKIPSCYVVCQNTVWLVHRDEMLFINLQLLR